MGLVGLGSGCGSTGLWWMVVLMDENGRAKQGVSSGKVALMVVVFELGDDTGSFRR